MTVFLTKAQATAASTNFIAAEADRLNVYLSNLAAAGIIGGTYNYNPAVPDNQVDNAVTALIAAGWTGTTANKVAKTITVL